MDQSPNMSVRKMSLFRVPAKVAIAHPHDLLTRCVLFDVELFGSLLRYYGDAVVVKRIDINSLKCESPTTIDSTLREVIGDLRFSANCKAAGCSKIFFFFAHQSTKEKTFCVRCLRELLEFYEQCISAPNDAVTADGKLPYPIMVVLYHGKPPWGDKLQLRDLIAIPQGMNSDILLVTVIFIDLSKIDRNELKGHPALVALFDELQSYARGDMPESFERIIGHLEPVKDDPRCPSWTKALTRHFLATNKTETEVATRAISKLYNKQETDNMVISTLEEVYLEGERKGKEEGKEEGIKEAGAYYVLSILRKRFGKVPEAIVHAVSSYKDPVALESLVMQAATCQTLGEFAQDLAYL